MQDQRLSLWWEHFSEHLVAKIRVIKVSIRYLQRKYCLSEHYFDKFFLYQCQFGSIWGLIDDFFFLKKALHYLEHFSLVKVNA